MGDEMKFKWRNLEGVPGETDVRWRLTFVCRHCMEFFEDDTAMPLHLAAFLPRLCPACEFVIGMAKSKQSFILCGIAEQCGIDFNE